MAGSQRRKTGKKKIAVAIEMQEPHRHHHDCHRGMMTYAKEKPDWELVLDPYLVGVDERAGAREYAGVLGRIDRQMAADARAAGVPMVNHWLNTPARGLPGVYADRRVGSQMVAEHLLARGYRQIGYVGLQRDRADSLCLAGFEPPVKARGLTVEKIRFPLNFEKRRKGFGDTYGQLYDWLGQFTEPVGLFVPMDAMALYVVQICRRMGLRLPHAAGIVTHYDNPVVCLKADPTLSSIEPDNEGMGYQAAALLDRLMQGEPEPDEPIWVPPTTLRVRGSSDAFVSEDPLVSKAMRYITEHSDQTITVRDVAKAVGASERTLARRFEKYLGLSVYGEITRVRAEYIKRVLVDTDQPLSVIAEECGFDTTSHLARFFRKETGRTPSEYRSQHRSSHATPRDDDRSPGN
jgi:LacI family transcriptional regulator